MDISTQHVWDYAGDGYVHRLIQNKPPPPSTNNVLTQARSRHPNAAFREDRDGADMVPREKMEAMANEYTFLLTSQLEGQRAYFEGMLERAVDKASSAAARAEDASATAQSMGHEARSLKEGNKEMEAVLNRLEKAMEKADIRAGKFEKMAREMGDKWREEKMLNEGLLKRIHAAEERAKEKDDELKKMVEEKAELEDMNRDLTIFISSQDKVRELQAQGEEVEMGTVSVPEQEQKKRKGKGRKK